MDNKEALTYCRGFLTLWNHLVCFPYSFSHNYGNGVMSSFVPV